jgi:hypothetical protein
MNERLAFLEVTPVPVGSRHLAEFRKHEDERHPDRKADKPLARKLGCKRLVNLPATRYASAT